LPRARAGTACRSRVASSAMGGSLQALRQKLPFENSSLPRSITQANGFPVSTLRPPSAGTRRLPELRGQPGFCRCISGATARAPARGERSSRFPDQARDARENRRHEGAEAFLPRRSSRKKIEAHAKGETAAAIEGAPISPRHASRMGGATIVQGQPRASPLHEGSGPNGPGAFVWPPFASGPSSPISMSGRSPGSIRAGQRAGTFRSRR